MSGVTKVPNFACCIWNIRGFNIRIYILRNEGWLVSRDGHFQLMECFSWQALSISLQGLWGSGIFKKQCVPFVIIKHGNALSFCYMNLKIYFFLQLEVIAMHYQERQRRLSLSWRKFSIFVSNEHRLRYSLCTPKGPLHLNQLFQEH